MAEQNSARPTTPVEIRVIFDNDHYRCELREGGRFFKAINGDFLDGDRDLTGRVSKLTEVMGDGLNHLVALGTGNINDYFIHTTFQPVANVYTGNVAVHPEDAS